MEKRLPLMKKLRGRLQEGIINSSTPHYTMEGKNNQGEVSIINLNEWLKDYASMAVIITIEQTAVV